MAKHVFAKGNKLGGKNKIPDDMKRAFALACPDAIAVVLSLMNNSKDDNVRIKAANIIIERHLGKAVQPIGNDGDNAFVVSWLKQ